LNILLPLPLYILVDVLQEGTSLRFDGEEAEQVQIIKEKKAL